MSYSPPKPARRPDASSELAFLLSQVGAHGAARFAERDQISYCRGVALKADDPDTIFVGNGDFIPGKRGAIQRTVAIDLQHRKGAVGGNPLRVPTPRFRA